MDYNTALSFIHSRLRFGVSPGLDRIEALLARLNNPQNALKCVHIAGTNGKGSTAAMIAASLQSAGHKTGLFTSPYIIDFCERIQINGKMISRSALAAQLLQIEPIVRELDSQGIVVTEFELITALAFNYFLLEGCDYVVLETGLGGRLDSTNVITSPQLSVITSISLDHTDILGSTVSQIAAEKCGIIKQNVPVVSYCNQPAAAISVINKAAKSKDARVIYPDLHSLDSICQAKNGTSFVYKGLPYQIKLLGEHQLYNALTAIEALHVLGVAHNHVAQGLLAAYMPARLERLCYEKRSVLLDGSHNKSGGEALAAALKQHYSGKSIVALIGLLADKECEQYIAAIAPLCKVVVVTDVNNPRSLPAAQLQAIASKYAGNVLLESNYSRALSTLLAKSGSDDLILICGSLYLAADLRKLLTY